MIDKSLIIVSLIGLFDSAYLSILKFSESKAMCLPGIGDCWTVNTSRFSEWNGIPISLFGIAAYVSILIILLGRKKVALIKAYGDFLAVGITTFGFIFSLYLTYLQVFVIKAICPFCILSAVTMSTAFVLSLVKILKEI